MRENVEWRFRSVVQYSFKSFEVLKIKCKVNHKMVGKTSFSEIVTSQTNALNADKLAFVLRKLI